MDVTVKCAGTCGGTVKLSPESAKRLKNPDRVMCGPCGSAAHLEQIEQEEQEEIRGVLFDLLLALLGVELLMMERPSTARSVRCPARAGGRDHPQGDSGTQPSEGGC